ncbi:MAG: TlpA family protein disulfide reductase [Flavobacteriaceae bacterium]|nr:TlpA family protein disulfide reductase [Flavobacteriaceae bacterium]
MKFTIALVLLLFFTLSFAQSNAQKVYYKDVKGAFLSQKEFDDLKTKVVLGFKKQNINIKAVGVILNIRKTKDSIIKTFKIDILSLDDNGTIKPKLVPNFGDHLVGKKLPMETLKNINGNPYNLEDIVGKPTMINFWFTNCKPCIDGFPALNSLKSKYSNRANFISITFDDKDKVEKLISKFPFIFEKLIAAKDYTDKLKIQAYPTSLFIDKEGIVQYAEGGLPYIMSDNGEHRIESAIEFEEILEKLLK